MQIECVCLRAYECLVVRGGRKRVIGGGISVHTTKLKENNQKHKDANENEMTQKEKTQAIE